MIINNKNYIRKSKIYHILIIILIFSYNNIIVNEKENNLKNLMKEEENRNFESKREKYEKYNFLIIKEYCPTCGLFSYFIFFLGCIHKYLLEGYIPIIDIKSFPNVINGFNTSKSNYWEIFFEQPFGFTLEGVLQNAKNIKHKICIECKPRLSCRFMPFNEVQRNFWHYFANKYLPIKKELINLSKIIMYKLFKNSENILGVLTRGTDYINLKPHNHPIPPKFSVLINDVKEMDRKNNYKYIFFSTEDDKIRDKFIKIFSNKVKYINTKMKTNYNYSKNTFLGYNANIKGNVSFFKIYIINIIILSKCLDIITARCNGSAGIFILTKGFRNVKVYNLGLY